MSEERDPLQGHYRNSPAFSVRELPQQGLCKITAKGPNKNVITNDQKERKNIMNANANSTKVITSRDCRLSYFHGWEPTSAIEGAPARYSTAIIIKKTDPCVARIRAAIEAAYHEGENRLRGNGKSVPPISSIRTPLRDGDTDRPDDPSYAGCYFINASSRTAPGIVDADRNPILDRAEVYSGCYCRVSISFYAYNTNGNRGIACGLNNIQKIRDGEPLGGRVSAEMDFATEDDDDDEDFLA